MGITQQMAATPEAALDAGIAMARKIAACAPLSIKATLRSAQQYVDLLFKDESRIRTRGIQVLQPAPADVAAQPIAAPAGPTVALAPTSQNGASRSIPVSTTSNRSVIRSSSVPIRSSAIAPVEIRASGRVYRKT